MTKKEVVVGTMENGRGPLVPQGMPRTAPPPTVVGKVHRRGHPTVEGHLILPDPPEHCEMAHDTLRTPLLLPHPLVEIPRKNAAAAEVLEKRRWSRTVAVAKRGPVQGKTWESVETGEIEEVRPHHHRWWWRGVARHVARGVQPGHDSWIFLEPSLPLFRTAVFILDPRSACKKWKKNTF